MRRIKIIKNVICIIILSLFTTTNVLAVPSFNQIKDDERKTHEHYYQRFIDSIKLMNSLTDIPSLALNLDKNNKKLIIGCSPVVFMAKSINDKLVENGYDVVGFGGVMDCDIKEWVDLLTKKYTKIVLWGTVNDVLELSNSNLPLNDYYELFDELVKDLDDTLEDSPLAKLIVVEPKVANTPFDIEDSRWCKKFNLYVGDVNNHIENMDFVNNLETISLDYPTNEMTSEWYIHYTDKDIFNDIFERIDML